MLLNRLRGNPKDTASTPHAPRSILPDNIPLEFQVLLSACRVFLGTEEPARLEAMLAQGPDWEKLLRLANRHGVMPLLYRSISKNCPQAVPQEWLRRLMLQYMQNAARNMKMTAELLRIIDLFEVNGIAAIPFKGPALAQQIYGDITLRSFVDLDIIVPREDVLRAKDVLISQGYNPEIELDSTQEEIYLKSECEYNFHHPGHKVRVEVHWRVNPSCYCIDYDVDDVWSRLRGLVLKGREVPTLSPEDLLISLCIHGARHNWCEKKQIFDMAALVDLQKDLNWEYILAYSRKRHMERLVLLGLLLAEKFMGVKLPEPALRQIEKNGPVKDLASRLQKDFEEDDNGSSRLMNEMDFWFRARERLRDRVSCIIRLALEPTPMDLMKTPLPVELYPLYYLIHPVRMVREYGNSDGR